MRNRDACFHLENILDKFKKSKAFIKISPDRCCKTELIEKFKKIIEKYNVSVYYFNDLELKNIEPGKYFVGHRERYIITDEFEIYIPGGLDMFRKNGIYKYRDEDDRADLRIDFIKN